MDVLFALLFLMAFIGLVLGLVKPSISIRWGNKKNRKQVLKVYGIALIIFFAFFSITANPVDEINGVSKETDISTEVIEEEESTKIETGENNQVTKDSQEDKDSDNLSKEDKEDRKDSNNAATVGNSPSQMKLHFIDVGQGDATLIETPSGKTILIDAGDRDMGKRVVSYIKSQGISTIDVLIATHPHADHIGGMADVINKFNIGQVYMPKVAHTSKTYEELLVAIKKKGLTIKTAKAGVVLDIDSAIEARMVAPNSDKYNSLNDYSAVLRVVYGSNSFLITGDAEALSEREMISKGHNLKADILRVGHHGSRTSTSPEFLQEVSPKYAIISAGADNRYGHPHDEILTRLSKSKIEIYRTDIHGNIIITADGKNYNININQSYEHSPPKEEQKIEESKTQEPKTVNITATIDNPSPQQNSTINLNVTGPANSTVSAICRYKSTNTTVEGVIGADGRAVIPIRVGRASKDFEVKVDVTVNSNGQSYKTQTSFTPQ